MLAVRFKNQGTPTYGRGPFFVRTIRRERKVFAQERFFPDPRVPFQNVSCGQTRLADVRAGRNVAAVKLLTGRVTENRQHQGQKRSCAFCCPSTSLAAAGECLPVCLDGGACRLAESGKSSRTFLQRSLILFKMASG